MQNYNLTTYNLSGGGQGGSDVQWTQIAQDGEHIASITINGSTTDVYAPSIDASDFIDASRYADDQEIVSSAINALIRDKQNVLTPGTNITIENDTISADVDLSGYYTKTEVDNGFVDASTFDDNSESVAAAVNQLIRDKQNKLTAGTGITIDSSSVISASVGGVPTFYTGQIVGLSYPTEEDPETIPDFNYSNFMAVWNAINNNTPYHISAEYYNGNSWFTPFGVWTSTADNVNVLGFMCWDSAHIIRIWINSNGNWWATQE